MPLSIITFVHYHPVTTQQKKMKLINYTYKMQLKIIVLFRCSLYM